MELKVCICGGGALGHVISGVLASKGVSVNLLTSQPEKWNKEIIVFLPNGDKKLSKLNNISSHPETVVKDVDYVILCLPGFMISSTLTKIKPYLTNQTKVGSVVSSNGFFWMAKSILPKFISYFGFQRVPYIARVIKYGESSELKGYKDLLKVSISENINKDDLLKDLRCFFDTPVELLDSIWPAAFTNSNPLLHTARLYNLFKDYKPDMIFKEPPLFYEDWDLESSELLLKLDDEFNEVVGYLPVKNSKIISLKNHYESANAEELTNKLRSISAFKGIRLQMKKVKGGYIPDWENRYFTEDIPFGLLIIKDFAEYFAVKTPSIDKILYWAQKQMGKEYIVNNKLIGVNITETGIANNFVLSINELL